MVGFCRRAVCGQAEVARRAAAGAEHGEARAVAEIAVASEVFAPLEIFGLGHVGTEGGEAVGRGQGVGEELGRSAHRHRHKHGRVAPPLAYSPAADQQEGYGVDCHQRGVYCQACGRVGVAVGVLPEYRGSAEGHEGSANDHAVDHGVLHPGQSVVLNIIQCAEDKAQGERVGPAGVVAVGEEREQAVEGGGVDND